MAARRATEYHKYCTIQISNVHSEETVMSRKDPVFISKTRTKVITYF